MCVGTAPCAQQFVNMAHMPLITLGGAFRRHSRDDTTPASRAHRVVFAACAVECDAPTHIGSRAGDGAAAAAWYTQLYLPVTGARYQCDITCIVDCLLPSERRGVLRGA